MRASRMGLERNGRRQAFVDHIIAAAGEVAALQMRDAAQRVQERLAGPLNAQERSDLMALLTKVVYHHKDPAGTSGA